MKGLPVRLNVSVQFLQIKLHTYELVMFFSCDVKLLCCVRDFNKNSYPMFSRAGKMNFLSRQDDFLRGQDDFSGPLINQSACVIDLSHIININIESSVSKLGHGCMQPSTKGTKSFSDNYSTIKIDSPVISSISNWCDILMTAVDLHIPKYTIKNAHNHPWIDAELLSLLRQKNIIRRKAKKTG